MNEFNIRKNLPSIKVDKELIEQLENYLLSNVPEIIGIEKHLIEEKYSLEIVDSLGTGKFNRISEFPLSLFQDGTKKIKFGFSFYGLISFSIYISFSNTQSSSELDISLKTNNPREKAQGIYNGLMERINQHKTYNFIFHNISMGIVVGLGTWLIIPIINQTIKKNYLWASYLTLATIIMFFIGISGAKFKPFSEFLTKKQIRYNKVISFLIWGIISYFIFGLGFGLLKDSIIK
jgi:hypothetical protein